MMRYFYFQDLCETAMSASAATMAAPQAHARRIKKRLFIPKLLFLPVLLFAMVSQHAYVAHGFWDTTWEVVAFLILLVASMGRVWTSAYISGRKNQELVVDGPYSLTRNPLYFFSFLGYLGAGLAFEKLTVCLAFGVMFFLTHWSTILAEENKLRGIFGETYDEYAKRVPRFVPLVRAPTLPDSVTFIPRLYNRAVLDCGLLMSVYILAHLIGYAQNAGVIPILIRNVP
jgi:protein-S-isoprenylcysteine O-methyltransferase Ste14